MIIITSRQKQLKDEMEKYYTKRKKWSSLKKICRIASTISMLSIAGFYCLFFVYIFMKIFGGNTELIFRIMITCLIIGFSTGAIMAMIEWKIFIPSWSARIWNAYQIYEKNGLCLHDMVIWFDADKIHCHIIFRDNNGKETIYYCRLDEFLILYEDIEEPILDLDDYKLEIPVNRKNILGEYISADF